jgi:hypothetical protein
MRLLACVVAVPILLVGWQWWDDTRTERQLAVVASAIAGRDVEVHCQSVWAELLDVQSRHGQVQFSATGIPEARLMLVHRACDRLQNYAGKPRHAELDCIASIDLSGDDAWRRVYGCGKNTVDTLYAIHTLAHEAYHTAGVTNEAQTNCNAVQAIAYTGMALGADQTEAELAARALVTLMPIQRGEYATGECKANGAFDLHPETPAFPTEQPVRAPQGFGGRPGLVNAIHPSGI